MITSPLTQTSDQIPSLLVHLLRYNITIRFPSIMKNLSYFYLMTPKFSILSDSTSLSTIHYNKVFFQTETGEISLVHLRANRVILESENGAIKLDDTIISNDLRIQTKNGAIRIDTLQVDQDLTIRDNNGSVVGSKIKVFGETLVQAENGYVDFKGEIESRRVNVKSMNGHIHGNFFVEDQLKLQSQNSSIIAEIGLRESKTGEFK
jgi:DUF4097 and DUF4098 domain-containing protein YvlB